MSDLSIDLTIVATGNEWDAPVYATYYEDGRVKSLSRTEFVTDEPNRTYFPHAVVLVDGLMSRFDAERQPGVSRG